MSIPNSSPMWGSEKIHRFQQFQGLSSGCVSSSGAFASSSSSVLLWQDTDRLFEEHGADEPLLANLADLLFYQHDLRRCKMLCNTLLEHVPEHALEHVRARDTLACCYAMEGESLLALHHANLVFQKRPKCIGVQKMMMVLTKYTSSLLEELHRRRALDQLVTVLDTLIACETFFQSFQMARFLIDRGIVLQHMGRFRESLVDLERALVEYQTQSLEIAWSYKIHAYLQLSEEEAYRAKFPLLAKVLRRTFNKTFFKDHPLFSPRDETRFYTIVQEQKLVQQKLVSSDADLVSPCSTSSSPSSSVRSASSSSCSSSPSVTNGVGVEQKPSSSSNTTCKKNSKPVLSSVRPVLPFEKSVKKVVETSATQLLLQESVTRQSTQSLTQVYWQCAFSECSKRCVTCASESKACVSCTEGCDLRYHLSCFAKVSAHKPMPPTHAHACWNLDCPGQLVSIVRDGTKKPLLAAPAPNLLKHKRRIARKEAPPSKEKEEQAEISLLPKDGICLLPIVEKEEKDGICLLPIVEEEKEEPGVVSSSSWNGSTCLLLLTNLPQELDVHNWHTWQIEGDVPDIQSTNEGGVILRFSQVSQAHAFVHQLSHSSSWSHCSYVYTV